MDHINDARELLASQCALEFTAIPQPLSSPSQAFGNLLAVVAFFFRHCIIAPTIGPEAPESLGCAYVRYTYGSLEQVFRFSPRELLGLIECEKREGMNSGYVGCVNSNSGQLIRELLSPLGGSSQGVSLKLKEGSSKPFTVYGSKELTLGLEVRAVFL